MTAQLPLPITLLTLAAVTMLGSCDAEQAQFSSLGPPGTYAMLISAEMGAVEMTEAAQRKCGDQRLCKVYGWMDVERVPSKFPLNETQVNSLGFLYTRDRVTGFEQSEWDCARYRRSDPAECLTEATTS